MEKIETPAEPISRAKLLFFVSRLIWDENEARRLNKIIGDRKRFPAVSSLLIGTGAAWLWPMVGQVKLANAKLDLSRITPEAAVRLWPIWFSLLDANEQEARACLLPFGASQFGGTLIEEPPGYIPPQTPDPALCDGLAHILREEAAQKAAYAPYGVFDVTLPSSLPLVDWGISRIRLVALRPERLWLSLIDARETTIAAFPWRPDGMRLETGLMIPEWAWHSIDLAAAALWRDLCVSGPEATPVIDRASRSTSTKTRTDPLPPRPLNLPRPRQPFNASSSERLSWGNEEDRAIITRRIMALHAVRGHYRRHEYVAEKRQDEKAMRKLKELRRSAAARASRFVGCVHQ